MSLSRNLPMTASRIRTRIVRIEGEDGDHKTTATTRKKPRNICRWREAEETKPRIRFSPQVTTMKKCYFGLNLDRWVHVSACVSVWVCVWVRERVRVSVRGCVNACVSACVSALWVGVWVCMFVCFLCVLVCVCVLWCVCLCVSLWVCLCVC